MELNWVAEYNALSIFVSLFHNSFGASYISYLNATKSVQVTSSEYDIHKGKIAIGRLHAGVLHRGMEVKVGLHQG